MDAVTLTTATGLDLFGLFATVVWHAIRIGAALQVLPVIGGRMMPGRARLIVVLALSVALSGVLPTPPPMLIDSATVLSVLREFIIGVALGMIIRLAFEAGTLAGELVSQGMGLSFATMVDPQSGASSPVLSQWFFMVFSLLFFTFDGHLALIGLLADSYTGLPIGAALPDPHALLSAVPTFFGACLRAGVLLALPVVMALLSVNIAFGVLSRAASQLNPMAIGLPVSLLVGLLLITLLTPQLQAPVQALFEQAFATARGLLPVS